MRFVNNCILHYLIFHKTVMLILHNVHFFGIRVINMHATEIPFLYAVVLMFDRVTFLFLQMDHCSLACAIWNPPV